MKLNKISTMIIFSLFILVMSRTVGNAFFVSFRGRDSDASKLMAESENEDSWEDASSNVEELDRSGKLDEPKAKAPDASIRFFSSLYDHVQYSAPTKQVRTGDTVVFEIIAENGSSMIENFPINCWLSDRATSPGVVDDQSRYFFLERGCPSSGNAWLIYKDGMRPRILFSIAKSSERRFLYVHCQYMKCSNASDLEKPPSILTCPWLLTCVYNTPVSYNDAQLSLASSDTVLITVVEPPQEIHIPPAAHHQSHEWGSTTGPGNSSSASLAADGGVIKVARWELGLYCFGSFVIGVVLMASICYFDRRCWKRTKERQRRLVKKDMPSFPLLEQGKGTLAFQLQPDVLAQTPTATKRMSVFNQFPTRRRHFSGHDGNPPDELPHSFNPSLSVVVDESTVIANDQLWMTKEVNGSLSRSD